MVRGLQENNKRVLRGWLGGGAFAFLIKWQSGVSVFK
jgi:hypothetical protein